MSRLHLWGLGFFFGATLVQAVLGGLRWDVFIGVCLAWLMGYWARGSKEGGR